jgi:hypothetical protein
MITMFEQFQDKCLNKRDQKPHRIVDLEDLEKDFALTKAKMQLSLSEVKHSANGK